MYIFLLCIFYNFYYAYLEILRLKIYFKNCARSKQEEQKTKGVILLRNIAFIQKANDKLEEWKALLEGKGLRISRIKTKYLRCNFSGNGQHDDPEVIIREDVVASTNKFKYLGSVI